MGSEYALDAILRFLAAIGIEVTPMPVTDAFLPGVRIVNGGLVFDPSIRWPGDLLHEAGHIATTPAALRPSLNDRLDGAPASAAGTTAPAEAGAPLDAEAIAWSYAACVAIGLDPAVVFHPDGYKGQSAELLMTYTLGVYPGVHGLVQAGMTLADAYPRMIRWLRD